MIMSCYILSFPKSKYPLFSLSAVLLTSTSYFHVLAVLMMLLRTYRTISIQRLR